MSHRRSATAFLALTLAFLGCTRPPATPARPLRVAIYTDPLSLDPHARNEVLTFSVLRNLYEALTAFDAGSRVGPGLAVSWENPDELTWIFHLRQGVKFHDGREFTARDVLFSFDRARNSQHSNVRTYLVALDRVEAASKYVVKMTTTRPYPILLHKLAFVFIVPAGSPEEIRQPVGTGPYRLAAYEPGRRLELRAFEHYWGGPPSEKVAEFLPVPDEEQRVRRLLAGDIDIAQEPGTENIERIRRTPGCRVMEQDSLAVSFLIVRNDRPPFTDGRLLRALSLALDRRALVQQALQGAGAPLGQMVSRSVFGYARDIPVPQPNPAAARALLAAAGFAHGLDLDLYSRQGKRDELLPLIRQLASVGVHVHVHETPWVDLFPRLMAGDVNFFFGAWFCLSGDASDFFDAMVHSPAPASGYGASNFNQYRRPELDSVIEESGTTVDLLKRRDQLERSMHALMADQAFIPLYSRSVVFGVRNEIEWVVRHDGLVLASTVRRRIQD